MLTHLPGCETVKPAEKMMCNTIAAIKLIPTEIGYKYSYQEGILGHDGFTKKIASPTNRTI